MLLLFGAILALLQGTFATQKLGPRQTGSFDMLKDSKSDSFPKVLSPTSSGAKMKIPNLFAGEEHRKPHRRCGQS